MASGSRALLWELPSSLFETASLASSSSHGYTAAERRVACCSSHVGSHALFRPREQPAQEAGAEREASGEAGKLDAWRESGFATLDEWREHTRTDLYRLNRRRRASGRPALTGARASFALSSSAL